MEKKVETQKELKSGNTHESEMEEIVASCDIRRSSRNIVNKQLSKTTDRKEIFKAKNSREKDDQILKESKNKILKVKGNAKKLKQTVEKQGENVAQDAKEAAMEETKVTQCSICCWKNFMTNFCDHPKAAHYECIYCNKIYKRLPSLERHLKTHGQTYKCDECPKVFQKRRYLTEHKLIMHRGKTYKCDVCHEVFVKYVLYYRHCVAHKEEVHQCDKCDKTFNSVIRLNSHKHAHNKPHMCEFCGRGFGQKPNLDLHRLIHTQEKPFPCSYCVMSFRSKTRRKIHETTHTGVREHVCRTCYKAFRTSTKLNDHIRTHTGLKPYKCELCDRSFAIRSNLTKHCYIHNGRPHSCDQCKKDFSRLSYLVKHKHTCKGTEPEDINSLKPPRAWRQGKSVVLPVVPPAPDDGELSVLNVLTVPEDLINSVWSVKKIVVKKNGTKIEKCSGTS